jgi:hypothetical protein
MPSEADRRAAAFQAAKADQTTINRAAFLLRQRAIQEAYAGWRHQEVAFAVAALFDILESQVRMLAPTPPTSSAQRAHRTYLRQEAVRACAELVRKFQPEHDAYEARRPDSPKTWSRTPCREAWTSVHASPTPRPRTGPDDPVPPGSHSCRC